MELSFDERLKNLSETLGEEDDIQRMKELIKRHKWIFAKSYAAFCPHEYTLREGWSKEDWEFFVRHIWTYGLDACFGKQSPKRYWFDHDTGYYYFIFDEDTDEEGNATEECCLVNRGNVRYFDFWVDEDLLGRIVRCKVKPGGAKLAQEDMANDNKGGN